jgi:hypothetical protein
VPDADDSCTADAVSSSPELAAVLGSEVADVLGVLGVVHPARSNAKTNTIATKLTNLFIQYFLHIFFLRQINRKLIYRAFCNRWSKNNKRELA